MVQSEQLYDCLQFDILTLVVFTLCRTPSPDMHLMMKSPSGKIPVRKDAGQPSEMESVVSLIGGYASGTVNKSLEDNKIDIHSAAARCQPYSAFDKNTKYQVGFGFVPANSLQYFPFLLRKLYSSSLSSRNITIKIPPS